MCARIEHRTYRCRYEKIPKIDNDWTSVINEHGNFIRRTAELARQIPYEEIIDEFAGLEARETMIKVSNLHCDNNQ